MGVFLHHEPCPRCGSRDNLARYADGSAWCFGGCGYREKANRVPVYNQQLTEKYEDVIILDQDLGNEYPDHVVAWLNSYGITVREALSHGWKYSPTRDQLVFIWYDEAGNPTLSQARNFWSGAKVKYFTQGSVEQILPIFRRTEGRAGETSPTVVVVEEASQIPRLFKVLSDVKRDQALHTSRRALVIVEDVVSAAKISRQASAMPCLGSTLSNSRLTRLRAFYGLLGVWLDADKWTNAVDIANRAKLLGFETKVIYTEKDPKCYENDYIASRIQIP